MCSANETNFSNAALCAAFDMDCLMKLNTFSTHFDLDLDDAPELPLFLR